MASRRRKWIKQLWAMIIRARRRNISHKKVRKLPRVCMLKYKDSKYMRLIRFTSVQIIQQVLEVVMEYRQTAWIRSVSELELFIIFIFY